MLQSRHANIKGLRNSQISKRHAQANTKLAVFIKER